MPKRDKALAAFGQNVAKFRTERGLSRDKLAEEASLDRTGVSGIERGVPDPGIKLVRARDLAIDAFIHLILLVSIDIAHEPAYISSVATFKTRC